METLILPPGGGQGGVGVSLPPGTLAERPAASPENAGMFYLATDVWAGTLFHSNGASWVKVAKGAEEPDTNGIGRTIFADHVFLHGAVAMTTIGSLVIPDWDGSPFDVMFDTPGTLERTDATSVALGAVATFQLLVSDDGAAAVNYGGHSWKIMTTTTATWFSPLHYNWHFLNPPVGDLEITLQGNVNHANARFTGTRFSDVNGPLLQAVMT